MKRIFDIIISSILLILFLPLLLPVMFLVWAQDFCSPFYIAERVGINGKHFKMVKLRSMVANADKSGVDSTSANDMRITTIGKFIRLCKLDELTQLWNVLIGDMSLVGPRPQVQRDVDLYTEEEKNIMTAKPGITDFSSIVFSDEGDILKDSTDPDLSYHQLIRPWKSRLAILYIQHNNLWIDLKLIIATAMAITSKPHALKIVNNCLSSIKADDIVIKVASRKEKLSPYPPPGSSSIVSSR
jgi:lipopolysaccharide/colanic/teichoic acid biosynthesis glycosyltransferase